MKNWIHRVNASMARWMYGRNGYDSFSKALFIISMLLYIISAFFIGNILRPVSMGLLLFSLYRCYSKNLGKRQKELNWYLGISSRLSGSFSIRKQKHADRKTHKYIRCKNCGTYLRVPKGVGKIVVTCPKCKNKGEMKA